MAKKKQTTGYDRQVTEENDVCTWKIGDLVFKYHKHQRPINLYVTIDSIDHACSFAKDLKEAGFFSEGFVCGWDGYKIIMAT